jgi:two-component system cell cycle sensor histidine kinase/response regulator CckA
LITDAIVPGIDGIGLTETVRKIKPNLPILIVSGYSLEDLTPNLPNNVHYLEKPFTLKILKDKVNLVFQAQDLVPSGNK